MLVPISKLHEDSMAGLSVFLPLNSPGAMDTGSGRVFRPSYKTHAKQWQKESGGKNRSSWEEYAKRLGLFPDDVEKGWKFLSGGMGESFLAVMTALGEGTPWTGMFRPDPLMVHQGSPDIKEPPPGFGFHTKTAEKVWEKAKELAAKDPEATTASLIGKAVEAIGVLGLEMTPEDQRMLEMAINWYIAGKHWNTVPGAGNNRIGGGYGSPGGPFRSSGDRDTVGQGAP